MAKPKKTIPVGLERAIRVGDTKMLETLLEGACAKWDKSMVVWRLVAANGHPKVIPVLIERGFDVDAKDETDNTALMNAVCAGNVEMVEALLEAGADTEIRNPDHKVALMCNKTALMLAAIRGDSRAAKILIERGADVNVVDHWGYCALTWAAHLGHPGVADLLIRAGANPNAKIKEFSGFRTVLEFACLGGSHTEVLLVALEAGEGKDSNDPESCAMFLKTMAKRHAQTAEVLLKNGARPTQEGLLAAARSGHPELVMLLLDAGAQVNVDGNSQALLDSISDDGRFMAREISDAAAKGRLKKSTVGEQPTWLCRAAVARHEETVEVLLRAGANANSRSDDTPCLFAAAALGQVGVVKSLIHWGADINAGPEFHPLEKSATPLSAALRSTNREAKAEMVSLLLDAGADVNAVDEAGRTSLRLAASWQEVEIVKLLLKAGADATAANQTGHTALMSAAVGGGNAEIVELLLDAGADVNAVDEKGDTSLKKAIYWGNTKVVKLLLNAGADANTTDCMGRTVLMVAVAKQNEEIVKLLLDAGADANAVSPRGYTILMDAAFKGNAGIVKLLLGAGANANAVDQEGRTPLMYTRRGAVADLLVLGGANTNHADKEKQTPLTIATQKGSAEVVARLLDFGVVPNKRNEDNQTLLMIAAQHGHASTIVAMRNRGIDANAVDKSGQTALIIAAKMGHAEMAKGRKERKKERKRKKQKKKNGYYDWLRFFEIPTPSPSPAPPEGDSVQELLKAGADVNAKGSEGLTAVMAAASAGNPKTTKLLLQAGAEIDAVDDKGRSALLRVTEELLRLGADIDAVDDKGQSALLRVTEELLRLGADPNIADHEKNTPLAYMVERGVVEAVDLLLTCGADPNAVGGTGRSPLMIAMRTPISEDLSNAPEHLEIVQKLLQWSANPNDVWEDGRTPLIEAAQHGALEIASALIDAGAHLDDKDGANWTALMHAANARPSFDPAKCMVKRLVEAGANVHATNNAGETALVCAVRSAGMTGGTTVIDVLVRGGALTDKKDSNGLTAFDHAKNQNNTPVLKYLREHKSAWWKFWQT